ncbi:MAG: prepilin-type N-terminal cleavage/methylation domain-containing protein [Planctomycetota bacterium]
MGNDAQAIPGPRFRRKPISCCQRYPAPSASKIASIACESLPIPHSPFRIRPRASAFTLIEVLLVITLLVIIGGLAAPSMMAGAGRSRMNAAGEELRTAWGEARLKAASEGKTYCFQCVVGTNQWQMPAVGEAVLATPDAAAGDDNKLKADTVVFRELLVATQPGDPPLGGGVGEGELSPAILFRPDGSSSDAEAILEDEDGRKIRVSLRGLTGTATVEDWEGE